VPSIDPAVQWLLRIALAGVLLRAALHKARDLRAFRLALTDYALLPHPLVPALAPMFIAVEVATASALLWPGASTEAAGAACALLVTYSGAIALGLLRGRRGIDCGCGGPAGGAPLGEGLLVRNALLLAAAAFCAAPAAARPLGAVDLPTVVAGGTAAFLLYLAADRVLAQAPQLRALRSGA
jgi:hypothetical protein